MRQQPVWVFLLAVFLAPSLAGSEPAPGAEQIVRTVDHPDVVAMPIGITAAGTPIQAVLHREDFDFATAKCRILLVGHSPADTGPVAAALRWFYTLAPSSADRQRFLLSAVPQVQTDRPRTDRPAEYPPAGVAYASPDAPEPMYLWRWIGMAAPDLVVEVRFCDRDQRWFVPVADEQPLLTRMRTALQPSEEGQASELAAALIREAACETGTIPAVRVTVRDDGAAGFLPKLLAVLRALDDRGPSPARLAIQQRLDRSPLQVAQQLSQHYGRDLPQVVYIPAVALLGRLRLGDLTGDRSHQEEVERIVRPFLDAPTPVKLENGSELSGHLIFSEMAERSVGADRNRYLELARRAADLAFDPNGQPRESMPFHNEMSDALFMGGPILAHVGHLTRQSARKMEQAPGIYAPESVLFSDKRYFDACIKHLRFMRALTLRGDGLYRHSPLDEAAWGRGNGFPALGLALSLTWWPDDRPDREELVAMLRDHLAALAPHQDRTGAWHQVIDRPESYRELTCTCMILFAAARGVRLGWLDRESIDPLIQRAWYAVRTRVGTDGRLVDVCTGTGKQKSLDDYFRRPAILGPDPRGGAMALLAAVEMADYQLAAQQDDIEP
ncbi:MAG: glycoside hydrolase family 88 protein [Pirellulaceae bacterium]|nr:glycoside hydrolase family 88 protein [Pirellulaceae bacterium]